jgi:hypothetical protein
VKLALCGGRSGVNIRLHEHVDKHGVEDPRAVFMSWDQRLSLQEAELIEYFDAMAASLGLGLHPLPAKAAAGKAAAAQPGKTRGRAALASTKAAPVVPPPTASTQPPEMQQVRIISTPVGFQGAC